MMFTVNWVATGIGDHSLWDIGQTERYSMRILYQEFLSLKVLNPEEEKQFRRNFDFTEFLI